MHDFRAIRRFQCKARYEGNGSPPCRDRNVVVETLYCFRRAGLQAIHAALDVIDLEQPNPPTSTLPEWLLIPAENVHFEVTWVYLAHHNDMIPVCARLVEVAMVKYIQLVVLILFIQLTACSESPQLDRLSDEAVILAYGDSLTYGSGVDPETDSYPAVLQQLSQLRVINAGIPGETSEQGLARLDKVLDKTQPQLVILCHGGNDLLKKLSKQKLAQHLGLMIEKIRASGAQVVMLSVPAPGLLVNPEPIYQEIAQQYNVVLDNDTIANLVSNTEFKSDPIHFNEKGYRQLAMRVFELLKQRGATADNRD